MKKNIYYKIFVSVILMMVLSCSYPKTIYIKKSYIPEGKLVLNTWNYRFDLGFVLLRPVFLSFGVLEPVYSISFSTEDHKPMWQLERLKKKKWGNIIYGKNAQKYFAQLFPLENKQPEKLKFGFKYIVEFETDRGKYSREFIYQPSQTYIYNSDRK